MKFKRLSIYIVFVCAASVMFISPIFSATYYVKNGGNDLLDGLSNASAWATVARVNDFAEAPGFSNGDIICFKRGSRWSNDETLGYAGGDLLHWGVTGLTIQDYGTGDLPILDGNTQQPIRIGGGITNLTIRNLDVSGYDWNGIGSNLIVSRTVNVIIDGIYLDGHKGRPTRWPRIHGGLNLAGCSGNLEIKNCTILNIMGPSLRYWGGPPYEDANAITVGYHSSGKPLLSGSVSIHDNTLHDIESDGLQLKGIHVNQYIYNNTIYNFGEQAIDLKINRYAHIYDNNLSRGSFDQGGSGGTAVIIWSGNHDAYPGYGAGDTNVYNNYIHDSDYEGIRFATGGITNVKVYQNFIENVRTGFTIYGVRNLEIYNNLIVMDKDYSCVGVDCSAFRYALNSGTDYSKIFNNSIYLNNTTTKYGIAFQPASGAVGHEIKNNIIQINRDSSDVYPLYIQNKVGEAPTLDHNTYYNQNHTNRTYLKGTRYSATDQSKLRNEADDGALFANPLFKDPGNGNLSLLKNSPCLLPDRTLGADPAIYRGLPTSSPIDLSKAPAAPTNLTIKY